MTTKLLSLDLGTTHYKAGLFSTAGRLIKSTSREAVSHHHPQGFRYFDPGEIWALVIELISEVSRDYPPTDIAAVGITSMAETGLLVDNRKGETLTPLIPWFDDSASAQVAHLQSAGKPKERFVRSGIRPNFKCSLAKLLWVQQENSELLNGSTWLSSADYVAFRLTGTMATDYSLAGRTYAFRIDHKTWDREWLKTLALPSGIFPKAIPSGKPVGKVTQAAAQETGLLQGTPVTICGHDHVCAAFAGTGVDPGKVFDSLGTAEALIGSLELDSLGEAEYRSGLVFGCHVAGGGYYWMGGMSASGGSLEWLRRVLGDPPLSYQELEELIASGKEAPTGIFYFPYLAGSGSPHTDIHVRGAFIGLTLDHSRADLVKAVLEGTAYEAEFIRQSAQSALGIQIKSMIASGGGARLDPWMQVKADISGCPIEVPDIKEATLLGAALVAGIGIGLFSDAKDARSLLDLGPSRAYRPDRSRHQAYQTYYNEGFLALQKPLRSKNLHRSMG